MLALPDDERVDYSFLWTGHQPHGPIAMAAVDPEVVHLDFHCFPPDRWHGVVNMASDMIDVVRETIIQEKNHKVTSPDYHSALKPCYTYRCSLSGFRRSLAVMCTGGSTRG